MAAIFCGRGRRTSAAAPWRERPPRHRAQPKSRAANRRKTLRNRKRRTGPRDSGIPSVARCDGNGHHYCTLRPESGSHSVDNRSARFHHRSFPFVTAFKALGRRHSKKKKKKLTYLTLGWRSTGERNHGSAEIAQRSEQSSPRPKTVLWSKMRREGWVVGQEAVGGFYMHALPWSKDAEHANCTLRSKPCSHGSCHKSDSSHWSSAALPPRVCARAINAGCDINAPQSWPTCRDDCITGRQSQTLTTHTPNAPNHQYNQSRDTLTHSLTHTPAACPRLCHLVTNRTRWPLSLATWRVQEMEGPHVAQMGK